MALRRKLPAHPSENRCKLFDIFDYRACNFKSLNRLIGKSMKLDGLSMLLSPNLLSFTVFQAR